MGSVLEGIIFQSFQSENSAHQPFISLLLKRSSSHLALTLSARIHYLIHLLPPYILLHKHLQTIHLIMQKTHTCTQAAPQPPTPSNPPRCLNHFTGNRLLGCVEEGSGWKYVARKEGADTKYSQEEYTVAAASVWDYSASGASRLRDAIHLLK